MTERLSTRALVALTITLDIVILVVTLPLERYALQAAHDSAPIPVLLALLAANVLLLALVATAMFVNAGLLGRIAKIAAGSSRGR